MAKKKPSNTGFSNIVCQGRKKTGAETDVTKLLPVELVGDGKIIFVRLR
jgi:hypothetical protein